MNEAFQSFGAELARQRQAKGLSIAQLSDKTKIAEPFLEKLENGQYDFLPQVYVKAFLRTVSGEIGLDPEVMVKRLMELTAVPDQEPESAEVSAEKVEPSIERRPPKEPASAPALKEAEPVSWKRSFLVRLNPITLGLLLVAVTLVLFILLTGTNKEPSQEIDTGIAVEPVGSRIEPEPVALIPIGGGANADTTARKEISLTVRAAETAWVRIVHHDSLAEEGLFASGESRTFTSFGKFYLKIGNAGGIRLILDGRDLGAPGEKGRVANVMVTSEGITNVTFAEFPPAMGGSQP